MITLSEKDFVLEMKNITKIFPGVKALDDVTFKVRRGEVMALLGENGAGKSTLVKILCGALERDVGNIYVDGVALPEKYNPLYARNSGISIIYQELSLISQLSVAENIFLTHEPTKKVPGFIDYQEMYKKAEKELEKLKADIDPREKVCRLSLPDQQMVEIAKALATNCRIIIMDEPTTSLTWNETQRLFDVIRTLKQHGVMVIYISHRLDEIFQIADRATVLRDGRLVGSVSIKDSTKEDIISMMTGQKTISLRKTQDQKDVEKKQEILLQVENITDHKLIQDISFSVYENEVLGIGGLIGSKRTELARMIFGADKIGGGVIYVCGEKVDINSPQDAIKNGIGYLSENRKEEGLNLGISIRENIIATDMNSVSDYCYINWSKVQGISQNYIERLNIKGDSITKVGTLSGGNQQKVAISKWLHAGCRLLIFDEPTRGIDVAAKAEVYEIIRDFAKDGRAAIVISSEANELLSICDRIIVMSKGKIVQELDTCDISCENSLHSIIMRGDIENG